MSDLTTRGRTTLPNLTHVSLCSGIGGIDLAAVWAGFQTVAVCEIDPFCRRVLAKNFPNATQFDDVRTLSAAALRERGIGTPTLISAGFPCQDISQGGTREGIYGRRSGLFFEVARVVREVRPRWVLLENVKDLRYRGLNVVVEEFAAMRYDLSWLTYTARACGAPHTRARMFLVAHPFGERGEARPHVLLDGGLPNDPGNGIVHASSFWKVPFSGVLRVDDGISRRMDQARIRALGNAVVPQQVYPILQWIANYEREVGNVA